LVKEILPNKLFKKIKIDEHGLVIVITDKQAVKFVFDQSNINIIQDDFEMIEFIIKHFNRFNNDAEIIIAKQSEKVKKE
jgi:sulfur relay (sulfurtransferase) DsrC/TusE family protein